MANPPKPWKAEYAKSSRSSCKSCKSPINKDVLRLGKMVVATQFDGFMPMWNHAACIFKKANQIKSVDDVEGIDLLRWEDQQRIKAYTETVSSSTKAIGDGECTIEASKTSRSTCRHCEEKIMKGMIRISLKPDGQGARGLAWYHAKCFIELSPSSMLEKLSGWDRLTIQDREEVSALVRKSSSLSKKDSKAETQDTEGETSQKVASKGTKRRKGSDEHVPKILKAGEDTSAGEISRKDIDNSTKHSSSASDLESKLEEQTKSLWAIKDELKKCVTIRELREMLEANAQDSGGAEYDLRERCADGMLFGALDRCPLCSGSLIYSGGQYRCHGYLSAWSKCSYSTTEPVRLTTKWKIPEESNNQFLCKWFKSQKAKKPNRILPPSSNNAPIKHAVSSLSQQCSGDKLEDLKVAISGKLQETLGDLKCKLQGVGVAVHAKIKKDTSCLVVGEQLESDPDIKKARRMKLPIVKEDYLFDCITRKKMLPFDLYKVKTLRETSGNSMVTVKVKGRSAVHESSGLQDTGHILEDGKSIYNTTLNMSDLSTGVNSYYILQVIEEDKGSDCYVFRKWGRVGSDRIGGSKLEEMSKSDAIQEFRRLFLEKTGNPWEAWERRQNFEKQPGRFYPLDIDYGVKQMPKKQDRSDEKSILAPQLADLMKILFNVETYRAAMMEFEINMSEMPLGKLSKQNIQKGFEALTEIQNILNDNKRYSLTEKESLIINASNRFFTLIPSIRPHVIKDEDDFKIKVKMLEALQDIEIASRLVGFDCETGESIDDKYRKLNCDIVPLPHDTEDYKLVEHYLLTTHAPTHKEWTLELEDVFALERKGESDTYTAYRDSLQNKMLLWHGSRLTNFVGILSQGLRIAPPEAPATGYMFGKGIYFADLVSKSAQYCFVDKKDPVGLLLLSEVALGETFELKKASYMDRPPKGKHSTKGLGKTIPMESEYVKWKDEVIVPCGKPVSSHVRASELLYNEYIVYDTAQVKMQFLLKVRFHHKR